MTSPPAQDVASDPVVRDLLCAFRTTAYWEGKFQRPSWADVDVVEAYVAKLETALRDIRNLHQPVGDETQPGVVHRAVVVGIVNDALGAAR